MRHNQSQITTFQETTYELPSSVDLFLISCPNESLSSRHYEMKQSSRVVRLPSLVNNIRTIRTRIHA